MMHEHPLDYKKNSGKNDKHFVAEQTYPLGPLTPPSTFENLNVKSGDFDGGPPEADKALREFAALKTGGSSSIKESGKVTIPKEGGPGSQQDRG